MSFEIETCPICHVSLVYEEYLTLKTYHCPKTFHTIGKNNSSFPPLHLSHYKVTIQPNFEDKQEIVAFPYHIDITDVILIYKYVDTNFAGMKYILQLKDFKIDNEDKMLKKIQNLIPFI